MSRSLTLGILLILVGVILFLKTLGIVNEEFWEIIWPAFLLIPAITIHISFFTKKMKDASVLVPGGIFLVLSILFFYHTSTGWEHSDKTWPIYILAVAFGLFEFYLFGKREKTLLVPISVLTAVGLVFLLKEMFLFSLNIIFPIFIIIVGVFMLIRGGRTVGK